MPVRQRQVRNRTQLPYPVPRKAGQTASPTRNRCQSLQDPCLAGDRDPDPTEFCKCLLPEKNQWERHLAEQTDIHAAPRAFQAVVPGSPHDARSRGSVPADLAAPPKLGERNPEPEVGEHAAKASCPAFRDMHLHAKRRVDALRPSGTLRGRGAGLSGPGCGWHSGSPDAE